MSKATCIMPAQLRLRCDIYSELRLFITFRCGSIPQWTWIYPSFCLWVFRMNSSTSDGVEEVPAAVMGDQSTGTAVSPGFSRHLRENHHMVSVVLCGRSRHLTSSWWSLGLGRLGCFGLGAYAPTRWGWGDRNVSHPKTSSNHVCKNVVIPLVQHSQVIRRVSDWMSVSNVVFTFAKTGFCGGEPLWNAPVLSFSSKFHVVTSHSWVEVFSQNIRLGLRSASFFRLLGVWSIFFVVFGLDRCSVTCILIGWVGAEACFGASMNRKCL